MRRVVVGAALVVGLLLTGLAGRADAVDYNDATGVLMTSSGAVAITGLTCGLYGASISVDYGANTPDYVSLRWVNANTGRWATGWSAWEAVTGRHGYVRNAGIGAGNWRLAFLIADWNGRAWSYDTEYARVTNTDARYPNSYCHVGR